MGYTVKWGLHDRHTPEGIKFMNKLFSVLVWQNNSSGLWQSCFENQSRANTHDMSNQILNSKFSTKFSTSTTMVLNLVSIWAASSLLSSWPERNWRIRPARQLRAGFRKFSKKNSCFARAPRGRAGLTVYPPRIQIRDVAASIARPDHRKSKFGLRHAIGAATSQVPFFSTQQYTSLKQFINELYSVWFNIFVQIPSPSSVLFGGCGCCCYVFVCLVWKESAGDGDNLGFLFVYFHSWDSKFRFFFAPFHRGDCNLQSNPASVQSHPCKNKKSDILFTSISHFYYILRYFTASTSAPAYTVKYEYAIYLCVIYNRRQSLQRTSCLTFVLKGTGTRVLFLVYCTCINLCCSNVPLLIVTIPDGFFPNKTHKNAAAAPAPSE